MNYTVYKNQDTNSSWTFLKFYGSRIQIIKNIQSNNFRRGYN